MVVLRPVNLRWINDTADDPNDLCVHGEVEFRIGADVLLSGDGLDWTLSAAALYLLRTLSRPHTRQTPVGDHLFPCCGYPLFEPPSEPDVAICECPSGEDFEVLHEPFRTGVRVRAGDGREWRVGWQAWASAVFGFADRVSAFYAACSPKTPTAEDAAGFAAFVREWERRRGLPFVARG